MSPSAGIALAVNPLMPGNCSMRAISAGCIAQRIAVAFMVSPFGWGGVWKRHSIRHGLAAVYVRPEAA